MFLGSTKHQQTVNKASTKRNIVAIVDLLSLC